MHPEEAGIISVVYQGEENQPFVVAYFKYNNNRPRRRTREAPVAKHRSRKSNPDVSYNTNPFSEFYFFLPGDARTSETSLFAKFERDSNTFLFYFERVLFFRFSWFGVDFANLSNSNALRKFQRSRLACK